MLFRNRRNTAGTVFCLVTYKWLKSSGVKTPRTPMVDPPLQSVPGEPRDSVMRFMKMKVTIIV